MPQRVHAEQVAKPAQAGLSELHDETAREIWSGDSGMIAERARCRSSLFVSPHPFPLLLLSLFPPSMGDAFIITPQ
jgi:hypothetical protein